MDFLRRCRTKPKIPAMSMKTTTTTHMTPMILPTLYALDAAFAEAAAVVALVAFSEVVVVEE